MKQQFKSRKDLSKALAEKGIDTSVWSEEKWLQLNKGQAEIHMMALAEAMWDALNESKPKELKAGEWHVPFLNNGDEQSPMNWIDYCNKNPDVDYHNLKSLREFQVKISTAMCARVSYTVVGEEGKAPNYENDLKLHDRLAASGHWSPFEHCAKAVESSEPSGNFAYGWEQYRKTFQNENIKL